MSRFDPELLARANRYGRQVPHPQDEVDREERLERIAARDEDGLFPVATSEDILGVAEVLEDPVGSSINSMIKYSADQAGARATTAKMTKEQRLGRAVAEAIEGRVSELEAEQDEEPDFEAMADEQLEEEAEAEQEEVDVWNESWADEDEE